MDATQNAKVRPTMEEAAAAELLIVEDTEHRRIANEYISIGHIDISSHGVLVSKFCAELVPRLEVPNRLCAHRLYLTIVVFISSHSCIPPHSIYLFGFY